jgi:hypothetical protein
VAASGRRSFETSGPGWRTSSSVGPCSFLPRGHDSGVGKLPASNGRLTVPDRIRVFHLCDKFGIRGARTHGVSRLFTWWLPRFDASHFEVSLVGIPPEDDASNHLRRHGLEPLCLGRSRFNPAALTDLLRLVRQERPHILHTTVTRPPTSPAWSPR